MKKEKVKDKMLMVWTFATNGQNGDWECWEVQVCGERSGVQFWACHFKMLVILIGNQTYESEVQR